mmetsp:Transcript_51202/g.150881  ORF Transcript_51202/g.150881 Transcript_51202/m.150881 type:complete len:736 (+) Transcript_51202:439-2646(+)
MVLDEDLLHQVARLNVVDNVLGHLELGVRRELLHRVRLIRKVGLPRKQLEDDQPEGPHVERAIGAHPVGLLAQHGARELGRAVGGRHAHRDGLARAARILQVDDLPLEAEEHKVVRLQVAVHHVLRVHVLDDLAQAVDDELALVALERPLLEEGGERLLAVLEHDGVLLVGRVLVVVDHLDDKVGAQRLEEGDLAHKRLLGCHELERHAALRLHVDGELDGVEAAHRRRLLHLIPSLVQVGRRELALPHAAHGRDGRRKLLARADGRDPHLAEVFGRQLDQSVEINLLPDEDARVLAEPQPLEPSDQLVARVLLAAAPASELAPLAAVALECRLLHDACVQRMQVRAAAKAAEQVHLRTVHRCGVAVACERQRARHVGLGPRHRLCVEHVELVGRVRPAEQSAVQAVTRHLPAPAEDEDTPANRLRRVAKERAGGEPAGGWLDPRHGRRVQHVQVLVHLAIGRAARHIHLAADDNGGVAHACRRRRAVDVGAAPREQRRVEQVRVVDVAQPNAVPTKVVDLGRRERTARVAHARLRRPALERRHRPRVRLRVEDVELVAVTLAVATAKHEELGADEGGRVPHQCSGRRARDGWHSPQVGLELVQSHVIERLLVGGTAHEHQLVAHHVERAADARVGPPTLGVQGAPIHRHEDVHVVQARLAIVAAKDEDLGAHQRGRVADSSAGREAVSGRLGPEGVRVAAGRVEHKEVVERPAAAHPAKDEEVFPDERGRLAGS